MTEAQRRRLYFPAWRRAFTAAWETSGGVVRPRPAAEAQSDVRLMTWKTAEMLAARRVRAITEEDLRHACNALAMRKSDEYRHNSLMPLALDDSSVSSSRLVNLSLDLVICWFDLIVDETRLGSMMRWLNPDQIEKDRIVRTIKAGGAGGYAARLALDMYGSSDWQDLKLPLIQNLYVTLRNRRNAWGPRTLSGANA